MDLNSLVEHLKRENYIESDRVEQAFRSVDRSMFVPEEHEMSAYEDRPLPLGDRETVSAPHMVAINTELLEPEPGSRILEVGSGSGYQVAILSRMADEITGVEIDGDLVKKSRENLERAEIENVEICHGSGLEPLEESFDRILYSCAISQERFDEAKEKLAEDGVLVAPVEQDVSQVVKKFRDGETTEHGSVRFVGFKDEKLD